MSRLGNTVNIGAQFKLMVFGLNTLKQSVLRKQRMVMNLPTWEVHNKKKYCSKPSKGTCKKTDIAMTVITLFTEFKNKHYVGEMLKDCAHSLAGRYNESRIENIERSDKPIWDNA